jgi:type II secretory pathway component PulF
MPQRLPEIELSPGEARRTISLDQFIALNDELAAIVRAGLPLERNLRLVANDIPGQLGETIQNLATRLHHGETLPQAVAAERDRFPGVYRAVIEAGLKTGRLSAALEGLSGFARTYADLRRAIGMALVYPLIVLCLAYGFFVYFVLYVAPAFLKTFHLFRLSTPEILEFIGACKAALPYWVWIVPVLLAVTGVWWIQSGRAMLLQPAWTRRTLGWVPWLRGVLANARAACFADLLALMVEQEVPLPQAVVLAAEATADPSLITGACELATALERGGSLAVASPGPLQPGDGAAAYADPTAVFPPLLRWLMVMGLSYGQLSKSLRHAGQTYRELSKHNASMVKQLLPVLLLLVIGGVAASAYCLSVFVPFTSLLDKLSVF